jgi:hypothetical protein
MSDLLYATFVIAGVKCKIVYYATSLSAEHRSVRIDIGNGWEDAPYKKYGFDTLYHNTSKSRTAPVKYEGGVKMEFDG